MEQLLAKSTVAVVDDDFCCRNGIGNLLSKAGANVLSFANAFDFLQLLTSTTRSNCVIIDYRLPEMSGIQAVKNARSRGCTIPFVVLTGFGTIQVAVEFMRLGVVDILEKPYRNADLLSAVKSAIDLDVFQQERLCISGVLRERMSQLTSRECEVLDQIVLGNSTKNIASILEISSKTVEVHRSAIVRKMQVESINQLLYLLFSSGVY